ncbi:MAG: two-component sensor histidine kinase, partial [Proteobacteria bacterium]
MAIRPWRSTFTLVLLVAGMLGVTAVAVGLVAQEIAHETLETQLDHRIAMETTALLDGVGEADVSALAAEIDRREAARSPSSLHYLLIDGHGATLAGALKPITPLREGYEEFFRYRVGQTIGVAQAQTTSLRGARLVVAADRADLVATDRALGRLILGSMSVMMIIGIGGAALIALAIRRRLSRIERTARAVMN